MTIVSQRTFASGEVTPSIYSRVDYEKYQTALRTCRNFYVKRHGGLDNRPGTKFIGAPEANMTTKLIPFIYDKDNAYVLEMTWSTFYPTRNLRFIKNGDYVLEAPKTITGITKANPGVVTSAAHGFSNGDVVKIQSVLGMVEVNDQYYVVSSAAANTFRLVSILDYLTVLDTSSFTAYSSGGTVSRVYTKNFGLSDGSGNAASPFEYTYAQTGNTMVFAHKWGIQELVRTSDTSWAVNYPSAHSNSSTAPTGLSSLPGAGTGATWYITTVKSVTYEESVKSSSIVAAIPTSAAPETLSWGAVSGRYKYNIYKDVGSGIGYIGSTTATSFIDRGYTPDYSVKPPYTVVSDDYYSFLNNPAAVCQYQQRRIYGGNPNNPETFVASQTGLVKNFLSREVTEDTDAFAATIVGKSINRIRHLIDLGKLIAMTDSAEVILNSAEDALTPTSVSMKTQSTHGCSTVTPIPLDNSAIFVESRGSAVRDLFFDFNVDGYKGNELSLFAAHLVDGYTIVDMALQKRPHSIIWIVRSDGVLLSLTYQKDQGVIGWAQHKTAGLVTSVACIPNGTEDDVYITVKRDFGSFGLNMTEKLNTRVIDEDAPQDFRFLDSYKEYNGYADLYFATQAFQLTGGTTWEAEEEITVEVSSNTFFTTDIGQTFFLRLEEGGTVIRFTVTGYTDAQHLTGYSNIAVPAEMRNVSLQMGRGKSTIINLGHLEGQDVTVYADGVVVANPNNASYPVLTVTDGSITLPRAYVEVVVGLPYMSDIETLDIDSASSQAMVGESKFVSSVKMLVEKSRGIFVGPKPPSDDDTDPLEDLFELKVRTDENYDDPTALQSGPVEVILKSEWNSNGRVFVRQVDPLPLSISSIHIDGMFPFTQQGA